MLVRGKGTLTMHQPAASSVISPVDPAMLRHLRHELRTPVNHIIGYSELLLEAAEDASQTSLVPHLRQLQAAGQRALTLVSEALEPARVDAGGIDLAGLRRELDGPFEAVVASSTALRQLAAAGDSDDWLSDLQRVEAAADTLRALVAAPLARLEPGEPVAGADPAELAPPELLAPPGDAPTPATSVAAPGPGTAHGTLLVVDDNEANRDVLARHLGRLGYAVERAEDGYQALAMIAEAELDLVLLDIMMPGLDGHQVLERLKADARTRDIPVIVISALDDLSSVVRSIEAGAADYLTKPFDPVLLRARIGACLEQKRLRDQEVAYLQSVSRVTAAAAAVETGTFDPDSLSDVADRGDELGGLARVFQRMAREVRGREQRLKQEVRELRITIDQSRKARQVAEITETDYFQRLRQRAGELRTRGRTPSS
jgi:DNA-binding response OmpR family regulator